MVYQPSFLFITAVRMSVVVFSSMSSVNENNRPGLLLFIPAFSSSDIGMNTRWAGIVVPLKGQKPMRDSVV